MDLDGMVMVHRYKQEELDILLLTAALQTIPSREAHAGPVTDPVVLEGY